VPADRRRLWLLLAGGALGVVLIAAVAAFVVATASASVTETLRDAGCTLETVQAQGRNHIAEPDEDFDYNTDPPTSGPHFPSPPPVSVYEEPVEQYRLIHDLEHGVVVIQYGDDVTDQTVNQLIQWWRDDPNGVVIAPYPKLGKQIALAAWNADPSEREQGQDPGRGILAKCPGFDEEAFDAFKDEYAFKGPERFEEDQLGPQ
jgi:hypothetical protein